MTREEFDALISGLEKKAAANPAAFKWRVGALATLGFSYLLFVLVASLAITAGLVFLMIRVPNGATIKLGIILGIVSGGLSWAIMRGLFVRMTRPTGIRLSRQECPELFRLIDDLQGKLRSPKFDQVILAGNHNAGVVQTPRLGVFGWHHNTLLLGLPLMQGVSVEEFRAILAHEFAHLSGSHGKFGAWIYRLRQTWERVFDQLARQNQGSAVLGKFLNWFWPKFNGHAFVLSRAQEYEADAVAARLTSPEAMAFGLIRTQVQGRWLDEKFWPDFFARAREIDAPPATLFREIGSGLGSLHGHPETTRWLTQAYNFETNNSDTHPCLKDRLRAILDLPKHIKADAAPDSLPALAGADAATALLGDQLPALTERIMKEWTDQVGGVWKTRHAATRDMSAELEKLETGSEATVETLWQRANIIIDRDGDEHAMTVIDQILTLDPKHSKATFVRGRFLLEKDDPEGVALIERAVELDRTLTRPAVELLYGHYSRTGQREKLRPLEDRLDKHDKNMAVADTERSTATAADKFFAADLTGREAEGLRELCAKHPEITAMHIARKQVVHFPEQPMYVITLTVHVAWWKLRDSSSNAKLVDSVVKAIQLEGNWITFVDEGNLKSLAKAIKHMPNSEVYRRTAG